ncbi:DNA-binding transcriptional regulator, MocR family, contains an aminotransferase domain [Paenimyroides ummariense]|uniref:DNA-binding transcriptional regulator, MocR family, contains an aminotransferase domain n=1 Tax=Paenimyroides ummariense TaxID=913024 RepID=A0A1I5GQ05_9FLAO|nr:PLP-dependent aminotransferase family protein [Paenimyroides ummariense]SFO37999.1 DNA-binding transcriptional regulator, MocR family, contains an aminotransferase domain [Paenimyroides ummariense]
MRKSYLYNEIADNIADKIKSGVLKAGEKLPSVRNLSREHGISINTAKRIFLELEARSLIWSKPQSGYYINSVSYLKLPLAEASQPIPIANTREPDLLMNDIYSTMRRKDLTLFSIGVPSGTLLPSAKLKKEIQLATRNLQDGGTDYEPLQGNVKLRRMIAARSLAWEGNLKDDDIVTTNGCMNALSLCLMALTKPGDTIALESPCYSGILQLAVSLGLKVLEIDTHPITGIEIDALKKLLPEINVCLLVPSFNTPLGYCMPDNNKKEIVSLLSEHNIPLIEDDTYGDLHFDAKRPKCCKSFDKDGNVLWCGSVSKTLAPGFRVGWVAPGRYKEQILKLKLIHSISSNSLINEAIGNFLLTGKYENHLRNLRRTLQENYQKYASAIATYFPAGTKVSRPQGGLALWIEFPKHVDTEKLYNQALKHHISISPGKIFTLQEQFQNCMRLCIGLPWTDDLELKLKQLGHLAKLN